MNEFQRDRELNIKTSGMYELNEWNHAHYNRTESTSYYVLDQLFKEFNFKPTDHLIDFGSGKGRVLFYVHHHAQIPVTGIELSSTVFQSLSTNKQNYLSKFPSTNPIKLVNDFAENYEIAKHMNVFYFFNPFSGTIFKKVLDNIISSIEMYPREITLIIYFPMPAYYAHLEMFGFFDINRKIAVQLEKNFTDEVLILTNNQYRGVKDERREIFSNFAR
ncbi:hypothetical protein ACTQ45_03270 [Fundicoccus sp. Sow4_D5]|uniref:hypothetical protein n=1 Tax=unclassified Fundicoccus TaxID=2761543 RepID=UPI003F92C6A4